MDESNISCAQEFSESTPTLTPLQILQRRFAILDLGGELRLIDLQQLEQVVQGVPRSELAFYKRADSIIKIERALEALPIKSDPKKETKNFWVNPSTKVFDSIAFTPIPTGSSTINYWVPPTVKPVPGGSWEILHQFLFEVICAGDLIHCNYLLQFLAHMLQQPSKKPGVFTVLLGGQGTGKGTFFTILRRIWSRTTLTVSDVNQILCTFNAALERNYVVCMDEALFSGDKKSIQSLKSMLTEPVIYIQQKYQPSRTIDSFHRFFATSNSDFFGQVDFDDRRYFILRVSDAHKTDAPYFDKIHKAINDDVCMGAMVHDLLQLDLTKFNSQERPRTPEHLSQLLQSMNGFDRYWFEMLCQDLLPKKHSGQWAPSFVSTASMQEAYRDFDPQSQRYRTLQDNQIIAKLKKYCPSAIKSRQSEYGVKHRGYTLPALAIARKEFAVYIGSDIDWDTPEFEEEQKK